MAALLKESFEEPKKDKIDEAIEKSPLLQPNYEADDTDQIDRAIEKSPLLQPVYEAEKPEPFEHKPVENLFNQRTESIFGYDYVDILKGNAYITYYGGAAYDTAGTAKYILHTVPYDTSDLDQNNDVVYRTNVTSTTTGSYVKEADIDFDANVGTTAHLYGKVLLNIFVLAPNNCGTVKIIAKLRKYDGSTETEITSAQREWTVGITGTNLNYKKFALMSDITTPTKLIKGDILRLTIEFWINSGTDATGYAFYHDPNSRERWVKNYNEPTAEEKFFEYGEKTSLVLHLPFKMQIN